jgi:hypothetical protein
MTFGASRRTSPACGGMQVEAVALDSHGGLVGTIVTGAVRVVSLRISREGRNVATPHGDGSTRSERGLLGQLVRTRFERRIVHIPVPAQPAVRTSRRASDDRVQLGWSRRVCRVEHELALGVARKDAVENDEMIVHVKVDARSAALNEVGGAALRSLDAVALGASAVGREDALDEDVRDGREHIGLEGNELAKLVGQRQDVLPQGNIGKDPVDQECGRICHAPARAARADAAAAAREGDQQVVGRRRYSYPHRECRPGPHPETLATPGRPCGSAARRALYATVIPSEAERPWGRAWRTSRFTL